MSAKIDTSTKNKVNQNLQKATSQAASTTGRLWPEMKENLKNADIMDIDRDIVEGWLKKMNGEKTSVNYFIGDKEGA